MSAISVVIIVLVVLLRNTSNGQSFQSPCPNTFQYRNDGGHTYGYIEIQPYGDVSTITTRANFTIATALPSSYVGKLQPVQDIQMLNMHRGSPINYRVDFPVTSPLPRLTSLSVNDNVLCYGPGDVVGPGIYVTTISLQHTLFFKGGYNQGGYNHGGFNQGEMPQGGFNQENFNHGVYNHDDDDEDQYLRPTTIKNNDNNIFNYVNDDNVHIYTINAEGNNNNKDRYPNFNIYQTPERTERPAFQNEYQPPTRRPVFVPPPRPVEVATQAPRPRPQPPRPPPPPAPTQGGARCGVTASSQVALIFNGDIFERGEWPWLVAIYRRSDGGLNFICSGSLVSDRHVVTAAHCMHKKTVLSSTRDIVVKVGAYNLEDWGDDYTVTRTIVAAAIHKDYNPRTLANDILIMTMVRSVEYGAYIQPLCLWSGNTDLDRIVGASGVVAGWGKSETSPGGRGLPRSVRVPIVSTSTCRASKPDFHKLTSSNTLCAGDRSGSGPCLGDSGAGLYVQENNRWQLRGVVSLSLRPENGDNSCNLNEYIVFTDTAQYLPWIHSVMSS